MTLYKKMLEDALKKANIEYTEDQLEIANDVLADGIKNGFVETLIFAEEGSLSKKDIKQIESRNPEIKVVLYRQGSPEPSVKDV